MDISNLVQILAQVKSRSDSMSMKAFGLINIAEIQHEFLKLYLIRRSTGNI